MKTLINADACPRVLQEHSGSRQRPQLNMAGFLIVSMLIVVPCTVFGECKITDTPYKYEIICSGYNPMSPPIVAMKNTKITKRSSKTRKVSYEKRESVTPTVVMSEVELKFMKTRNRQDGYRGDPINKEQSSKKAGLRLKRNT